MKQRVFVVGAGGHGAELQAYVKDLERRGWDGEFLGFLDDSVPPGRHRNLDVLGPLDAFEHRGRDFFENLFYLTALGSNPVRKKVVERIEAIYENRIAPWTLLHPSAWIGEDVEIGAGSCIAPGVIVTTRASIGRHCILNIKASVSHDCVIGDYVNINPGATICGWVNIAEGAYIGTGATLKDRVSVGANSIIGAGAVVVRDIPDNVTAMGVPARVIKHA
jgi:sugar O-acyltransferase (sialic acid O-acetyltransferase NeuD family)